MTEKQKKAISVLNKIMQKDIVVDNERLLNEEEYFLLLDFVVEAPTMTYIPWTTVPQPLDPVYGKFGKVTCDDYKVVVTPCTQNMEERQ